MSDQDVVRALDALEQMLREQGDNLDAAGISSWRQGFEVALVSAERGPDWLEIADRAHKLGRQLDLAIVELSVKRDAIKRELDLQAVGSRALKGYRPS